MSRILVIDDDSGHRLILRSRLSEAGRVVVLADNGARGLIEARAAPFDAFLVAARLGHGIDGFEVCRRLKGIPERSHVPVILFNDQAGVNEDPTRAYDAGCDAYVTRPDLPSLDHVLRVFLRFKKRVEELGREVHGLLEMNRKLQSSERGGHEPVEAGHAPRENGDPAAALRELGAGRPDGILIVDEEGLVQFADRGASEMLGGRVEGRHLGSLAPSSGLEAFARDARNEPREGFRFDLPGRKGRGARAVGVVVIPLLVNPADPEAVLSLVLLQDVAKRRLAGDLLKVPEPGIPRVELPPLIEAAREVFRPESLLGTSPAVRTLRAQVAALAVASDPVLLRGERGSGKERVARILHYSGSSTGAFLHARCAGQSSANFELELFGYVKGTTPTAAWDRPGLFQIAQDGTLFLEEVSELGLELQERVLRFLAEGTVQRKGAQRQERIDLRLIASSSAALEDLVAAGRFSRDLFERLARHTVRVPCLRERAEDLPGLARHFLQRFGARRRIRGISDDVLAFLQAYDWPGSLAELEDCIDQACALASNGVIEVDHLPRALREAHERVAPEDLIPAARPAGAAAKGTHVVAEFAALELDPAPPFGASDRVVRSWDITEEDQVSLDLYERKALIRAIEESGGDKIAAAKLLKVGKSTLYRKLKKYGIP